MGYEWFGPSLDNLHGIEPYEVVQVLDAERRWPRWAKSSTPGLELLTIWGRTRAGRPLMVAIREVDQWTRQIIGARDLAADELAELQQWEEGR